MKAGLGEKKVEFPDVNCSTQEFYEQVMSCFPKLANAGGFELLRCVANTKMLEPISRSVAESPKLLRQVVGKSRVYIRQIQKDLGLSDDEADSSLMKVCTV